MKKYSFIPHTADARIKVEASSIEELFACSLEAMSEIIKPGFCQETKKFGVTKQLKVSAPDRTTLLIQFLSEVLTLSYEQQVIFCQVKFKQLDDDLLIAKLLGTKTSSMDEDIKAVTYHEVEIVKNKSGNLETTIVFDI